MKNLIKFVSLFFLAVLFLSCSISNKKPLKIGYIIPSKQLSAEDESILQWLNDQTRFIPEKVQFSGKESLLKNLDVLWLHMPDSSSFSQWISRGKHLSIFKSLYENGARFLLTDYAAFLPYQAGLESQRPQVQVIKIHDDGIFDERGVQSWRGHPVFTGLFGGTFIWDGYQDQKLPRIGYFGKNFPEKGKVVGVEKSFVTVHRTHRLMVEYQSKKGKLLSVGAFVYFSRRNRLRDHLEKLIENSLLYLSGKLTETPATYWERYDYQPKQFIVSTRPIGSSLQRELTVLPATGLLFKDKKPGNNFFNAAGRRALVMGKENGGIDEVWVHPFRILRDYQAGIVTGDSVAWLKNVIFQVEIRPESITRIYKTPFGKLREIIFPSFERGGAIVHYRADFFHDVRLVIKFSSDLRWMWPYDEYSLGDVYFGYDSKLKALHVKDQTGDFYCIFGGDVKPDQHFEGAFSKILWKDGHLIGEKTSVNQVYHAVVFSLNRRNNHCLNYVLVGTDHGKNEALSDYQSLLKNPRKEFECIVSHYRHLLDLSVTIESPDKEFNHLWKWALIGTDQFFVYTPSLGKGLVAGFATTARGWNGGHKNSGRPGYAWYFGRDSEWSCFAIDSYGDFELVKNQLQFLQKFQDLSGKIFHELSTSGVVHYDAADATPLYVILAADYLRASGDLKFIKSSWTHIKKAMDFLYSTDTDGDLLIENTNVGHGWVEGGKLWGAHTTFYLAGLWAQTLKDAAYIAACLHKTGLSSKYAKDAEKVKHILNKDFWNDSEKFYYYGKYADNTYNPEKTVLPAVVMYYNLLDDKKTEPVLKEYAGDGFTSDWGARILSSESPLFNPRGYHSGSVWPLFTGWTSLAEYECGNSTQGFTHIYENLMIKNHWALGYVEEVMNGLVYQPSGVCPHQCWSETNVIHPAITGMIGWKPHALQNRVELEPRFPLHWDNVTVNNLGIGNSRLKLEMKRFQRKTAYVLSLQQGRSVTVNLFPEIPDGMIIEKIYVNDQPVTLSTERYRGLLKHPIVFKLNSKTTVILKHKNGVGMIPVMPRPEPGDVSKGYRIIDARLKGKTYIVDLEGKSGTEGKFAVRVFDQRVKKIKGGKTVSTSKNGIVNFSVPFPESKKKFVKKQIVVFLTE